MTTTCIPAIAQPVHRLARAKVLDHVADRPVLIVGFLIGEAVDESGIARDIGFGDGGRAQRAGGGGLEQLARDFADPLLHLRLAPLPGLAAQPVEAYAVGFRAVAGQDLQILDRHIELVAARIFQRDAIMRGLRHRDLRQAIIAANAMIAMDDQVAGRQRGKFLEKGVGILLALGAAHQPVAQHILFGQHRDIGRGEAMVKAKDDQRHAPVGGEAQRLLPVIGRSDPRHAMIGEQPGQAFARARRIAGDHHLLLLAAQAVDMGADRVVDIAVLCAFGGEVARSVHREVQHGRAFGLMERRRRVHRQRCDRRGPFGGVEIEGVGFERTIGARIG